MSTSVKDEMRELVDGLPGECTWADVMYRVYLRQKIQRGLDDVEAGRVIDHEEVFAELLDGENQVESF